MLYCFDEMKILSPRLQGGPNPSIVFEVCPNKHLNIVCLLLFNAIKLQNLGTTMFLSEYDMSLF